MEKLIILRDWNLQKGDKVIVGENEYYYSGMDGAYARWNNEDGSYAGPGLFNYLIYDKEKEAYIPYSPNKE